MKTQKAIVLTWIEKIDQWFLQKIIASCYCKAITYLLVALAIFIGAIALVPVVGFSVFPPSEKPMFMINIETPLGTSCQQQIL